MRTFLKATWARAYAAAGGLRRQHAGKLVVLTFHRVRPAGEQPPPRPMRNLEVDADDFRRLLCWLCARYQPVALGDWLDFAAAPPAPSFAITFDDGWADNADHAWPILRELQIPATIFLATGAVAERTPFWWQTTGLSDAEIERRKTQPPVPAGNAAPSADFLTWAQINAMGAEGLITFGAHGHRHLLLDQVSAADALADIRQCWSLLRQNVRAGLLPVLAWPNGNARDDLTPALQELGLRAAFSTARGAVATPAAARWRLPRNNVDRQLSRQPELWPWLMMRAK